MLIKIMNPNWFKQLLLQFKDKYGKIKIFFVLLIHFIK
jgi:hypothetical protein